MSDTMTTRRLVEREPRDERSPAPSRLLRRALTFAAVLVGGLVASGCAVWKLPAAKRLADAAQPYRQRPAAPSQRMLVVGDSTAVGTGATSAAASVVGLIGRAQPTWQIDNRGDNGARIRDLPQQLAASPADADAAPYDLVLILVGGNDVIRGTAAEDIAAGLARALALAAERARKVVLMPCGNVGHAAMFFPPLSWSMAQRSLRLHALAQDAARAGGATYVSLLAREEDDPFATQPETYHAADGLHPSDRGYAHWHRQLRMQAGMGL